MKRTDFKHYKILGSLFKYPSSKMLDVLGDLREIAIQYPGSKQYLDALKEHLTGMHTEELKEFYIKTFDVQALCFLDIGYVLFGEDYMRGEFLVALQQEFRNAGLGWGKELPDHLPNVLLLISESMNTEFVTEFSYSMLIPAIREMIRNFHSESNVYKDLLKMLLLILEEDFKAAPYEQYHIKTGVKSDFLDCIGCSVKKSKKSIKI